MSPKSVFHLKHTQITDIGTGKICSKTGKSRENTGILKITFEWGPCFCIDANCTLDCRYRSFRFKSVEDSLCKICNVVQSVDHVLLHCKGSNLTSNRTIFENTFCKYVPNYHSLSDEDKLEIVLNFKPLWMNVNENEACEAIYTFVKNTY